MLDSLFNPKSIAVVGASSSPHKVGHIIFRNILKGGYKGKVYPVNIKRGHVLGYKCCQRVLDIEEKIDLAVIAIPKEHVVEVLDQCGVKGVKNIVIITAGFRESGKEGERLEKKVEKIQKQYGFRILGPNCLGIFSNGANLNATFSDVPSRYDPIAFMSQSGALGSAVLDWASGEGIGLSAFVSIGNKIDISENDLADFWEKDSKTKVILGYLESFKDGPEFIKKAKRISRTKPIVILKAGMTELGSRAASSHTGSLATEGRVTKAALKQGNIILAETIEDLFSLGVAFAWQSVPRGSMVAIITNAGGPGVLATDAVSSSSLSLGNFSKRTKDKINKFLPQTSGAENPLDILGDADHKRYKEALAIVSSDENIDAIIVILTPQTITEVKKTAEAIKEASQKTKKPIIACFMGEKEVAIGRKFLNNNKIPNYQYPEEAVRVLEMMYDYSSSLVADEKGNMPVIGKEGKEKAKKIVEIESGYVCGKNAKEIVQSYGIKYVPSHIAETVSDAQKAAQSFGYPVVAKIVSRDIIHKTQLGGVVMNIKDKNELARAFREIKENVKKKNPKAKIDGIEVEKQVRGEEIILGIKQDSQFGPIVMFGLGGVYVETLKDISFKVAPLTYHDAHQMTEETRGIDILKHLPTFEKNREEIIDCILRISQLAYDLPQVKELDVNPLFITRDGLFAADVRVLIE